MKHLKLPLEINRAVTLLLILFTGVVFCNAQVPQGINYQTVVRNNDGSPIVNQQLSFRISILSGSPIGDIAYTEVHFVNSDQLGVVNFAIGSGSPVAGSFDGIDWGQMSHFLQVELDAQGGSTFVPMGTTPFFSVPYALFAESSGSSGAQVLNELEDVNTALAIGGQVLGYDGVSGQWIPLEIESGGIESLTELTDVSALTPANGQILRFNQALGLWVADFESVSAGVENLGDLTDVTSVAAQNGQVLKYNSSLGMWQPAEDLVGQGDNWGQQVVVTNSTLTGSGTAGSSLGLAQQGATNGQVLKWNGSTWNPANDLNTIQTLSLSGNTLSISNGNNVTLPTQTFAGWGLTGNSGTNGTTNFIGTTDNQPINFRVNNNNRIRFTSKGQIETLNSNCSVFIGEFAGADVADNFCGEQVFVGREAGRFCTTGATNTAVGASALRANITGSGNTAVGWFALRANTNGNANTSIGDASLYHLLNGSQNTVVGLAALDLLGSGTGNTALGYLAGGGSTSLETGSFNTLIGYIASVDNINRSNTIVLGSNGNLALNGNNRVRIGNSSMTSIGGQVGWTSLSDRRVKENVQGDVVGLDFILRLKPVTYRFNYQILEDANHPHTNKQDWEGKYDIEQIRFSGFIAQDVQEASAASAYQFSGVDIPDNEHGLWGLRYAEFVVPLVKAVQEQQEMIDALNDEISALRLTLQNLADEVQALNRQQTR